MSETIELDGGMCVTRYWGGSGTGTLFQVGPERGFTGDEGIEIIEAFLKLRNEKLPVSEHLILSPRGVGKYGKGVGELVSEAEERRNEFVKNNFDGIQAALPASMRRRKEKIDALIASMKYAFDGGFVNGIAAIAAQRRG